MKKQQRVRKTLSLLLIAVLCLTACPTSALADTPEVSTSISETPSILHEDISKRGAFEKHFERSDGSFVAAVYAEQVHYLDASGSWEEIDNRLRETTENGETVLKNRQGPMEVSFSQTPEDGIGSLQYDGYTLRWNVTAHASEAEKTVTPENPIVAEQTKTQNSLPDILSEGRALSAADLLNPEVFHPDLSIKQPDRSYSLNAAASADIPEADTSLPAGAEDAALAVSGLTGRVEYANALPGTDFTYTLHPGRVKEEIVLHTPSSITSYRTQIEAAGLSPALLEDGSVQLATSDGSIIFDIPAPFMYDANGAYSEEIVVRLEPVDEDTFELIYIPSYTWLQDSERAYPVTIDPTYQATPMMYGSDKTQDTYVYSGSPNSNYYASSYLKVGRNYQSYVRFPTLPDIGSNYIIHSAQLRLCAVSDAPVIRLCRVTGDWSSSGLTWNNQPGATAFLNLAPNGQFYTTYDVGETVCGWYSGKYPNYGFMIQDPGWSDVTEWNLYSSDCGNSNVMPGLQICYYAMSNRSLSTGTYFIRNRGTGKYLDVMNGTAANASNVGVNDFSGSLSQQWYVVNHGNGLYSIRSNLNRSYYLDVDGGQDTNERNVQIYADSSRRFRIRWDGNTVFTSITPSFSNTKALDVYGGEDASRYNTNVQIYRYNRGGNQTWEFEKVNDVVFDYLNILDDVAREYALEHGYTRTELIFNYIRSGNPIYTTTAWTLAAGSIKSDFVSYAEQRLSTLAFLKNPNLYLDDPLSSEGIDFSHFAATYNVLLVAPAYMDLGGWAGDLQSLVKQVKETTENSNNYAFFYNECARLLGASKNVSSFSMSDVLADVDAKNINNNYNYSIKLGDQLSLYYSSGSSNRFSTFLSNYSYSWELLRDYAKGYTNDTRFGVRQALYTSWGISTVTENQAQAAADAFADFMFSFR